MFNSKISVSARQKNNARFVSALAIIKICLIALLVQAPAFATDPVDVDPNPDPPTSSGLTTPIYVDESERVDTEGLAPGRYLIIVTHDDNSQSQYEIWVR